MKKFSIILNVVLVAAVSYLYYLQLGSGKQASTVSKPRSSMLKDTGSSHCMIAYIELDSMYAKINFISAGKKSLESEQQAIETEWQNGYRSLEGQKNEFLKKGNAITEAMAQEFQEKLLRQKDQVDARKDQLSEKLGQKQYQLMEEIQKKLKEFLDKYNQNKQFSYIFTTGSGFDFLAYKDSAYDITEDVIAGMNELFSKRNK